MGERRGMNLRLTDESRRGWDRACRRYGVTLTALVEAIGRELDRTPTSLDERTIEAARQIDHERGTRR